MRTRPRNSSLLAIALLVTGPATAADPVSPPLALDNRLPFPADRLDTSVYYSAPDSLHFEAHVPGNGYHSFGDVAVLPSKGHTIRFRYLVAAGTDGTFGVEVRQSHDTVTAWRMLPEGFIEKRLTVVGRWVLVELRVRTRPEANKLSVNFRLVSESEIGEAWVDDVSLTPYGEPITQGP